MAIRGRKAPHRLGLAAVVAVLLAGAALLSAALPRRVLMVSFDGMGGLDLSRRMERGELSPDGFAKARRLGFSAERLVVVTPSLTAVSHASLSTGALPAASGIVGNWFHEAGTPFGARSSGFDVPSRVPTLWEEAARQGKRVAALSWPGTSQTGPRSSTAVGLSWQEEKNKSVLWTAPAGPPPDLLVALPLGTRSFAPPKKLAIPTASDEPIPLVFAAVDGKDDGRAAYDEVVVLSRAGEVVAKARPGEWFDVAETRASDGEDRDVLFARRGKLVALSPDLSKVTVYLTPATRNIAVPEDYRRTLDRRAGVWPVPPDLQFLQGSHPDTASFVEQASQLARHLVAAWDVARARGDWDLLLAYQPIVDEAEHELLLTDPRQPGYSKERAEQCAAALKQVIAIADSAAARYLQFAGDGDVVFVSDHGMRPSLRGFLFREALRRKGWIKTVKDARGRTALAPDSPVDAVHAGGGTGFVYVNRSLPGMTPERVLEIASEIAEDLRARRDPDGAPLFSYVLSNAEAKPLGLDADNAGDLVVITTPGTGLRSIFREDGSESLFAASDDIGQHGWGPEPSLDGIFFHVGDGIAEERVPTFRAVDVAGRVAARLGLTGFPR
jgi:predicted AlkP superfamily phosphohydrolase/phosphomutase